MTLFIHHWTPNKANSLTICHQSLCTVCAAQISLWDESDFTSHWIFVTEALKIFKTVLPLSACFFPHLTWCYLFLWWFYVCELFVFWKELLLYHICSFSIEQRLVLFCFLFFGFAKLVLELRALHLLGLPGRCSITWATSPESRNFRCCLYPKNGVNVHATNHLQYSYFPAYVVTFWRSSFHHCNEKPHFLENTEISFKVEKLREEGRAGHF
jgi:hypothetical protein